MPNLMENGASWLGTRLKSSAGQVVTISQGTKTVTSITGWCSRQDHLVADAEGFTTSVVSYDWEFVAEDLPSDFEFRAGAVITATINGTTQIYEANPLGPNRPAIERRDASGMLLVVHTKRVS